MGLLCSRIGCSSKAEASLQFDAAQSTAILVDLAPSFGGMPLCSLHAASRTAPVGWNIVDRRTGAGNLDVWTSDEPAGQRSKPPQGRPPSRRPIASTPEQPKPAPASDPAEVKDRPERRADATKKKAPVSESGPPEKVAADTADDAKDFPWHKKYDENEDEEDLIVDSPLLSRAFRAAKG